MNSFPKSVSSISRAIRLALVVSAVSLAACSTLQATDTEFLKDRAAVLLTVPLDRGGAAVEIEVLDAETRQPLASVAYAHFAPLSEFNARLYSGVRVVMDVAQGKGL